MRATLFLVLLGSVCFKHRLPEADHGQRAAEFSCSIPADKMHWEQWWAHRALPWDHLRANVAALSFSDSLNSRSCPCWSLEPGTPWAGTLLLGQAHTLYLEAAGHRLAQTWNSCAWADAESPSECRAEFLRLWLAIFFLRLEEVSASLNRWIIFLILASTVLAQISYGSRVWGIVTPDYVCFLHSHRTISIANCWLLANEMIKWCLKIRSPPKDQLYEGLETVDLKKVLVIGTFLWAWALHTTQKCRNSSFLLCTVSKEDEM